MLEHGIDDDNDNWDGPIPQDILPESVQVIVYDIVAYREYLLQAVKAAIANKNVIENEPRQNYAPWARFREANIILNRWKSLKNLDRLEIREEDEYYGYIIKNTDNNRDELPLNEKKMTFLSQNLKRFLIRDLHDLNLG